MDLDPIVSGFANPWGNKLWPFFVLVCCILVSQAYPGSPIRLPLHLGIDTLSGPVFIDPLLLVRVAIANKKASLGRLAIVEGGFDSKI
mgnify:CR=1 FL=1